jgi:hypothetical protein
MGTLLFLDVGKHPLEPFQVPVDVSYDGVPHSRLPHDLETPETARGLGPCHVLVTNHWTQPALTDCLPKFFQLGPLALGDQFNPSIKQVPHRSRYLEARRLPFRLIAKTNALYPT